MISVLVELYKSSFVNIVPTILKQLCAETKRYILKSVVMKVSAVYL